MTSRARRFSDVSLEFAHVVPGDRERGVEALERQVLHAKRWVDALTASASAPTVSTTILVDDYFGEPTERDRIAAEILEVCASHHLSVDHVVFESACAAHAAEIVGWLIDDPRPGDGSIDPGASAGRDAEWLSTDGRRLLPRKGLSPRRGSLLTAAAAPAVDVDPGQPEEYRGQLGIAGYHDLNFEIQLFDGRPGAGLPETGAGRWSCPLLAATWQLLRLGVIRDSRGAIVLPERADFLGHEAMRPDPLPFTSRSTITLLTPSMLPVEHAVRLILSRLHVVDESVMQLRRSRDDVLIRPADLVLDRISYAFVPAGSIDLWVPVLT